MNTLDYIIYVDHLAWPLVVDCYGEWGKERLWALALDRGRVM
jgi:hypothetical protein